MYTVDITIPLMQAAMYIVGVCTVDHTYSAKYLVYKMFHCITKKRDLKGHHGSRHISLPEAHY